MKSFQKLFAATCFALLAMFIVSSCSKDLGSKDSPSVSKTYASAISGQFIPIDGDITLKSAPAIGGHQINCYDQKTTGAAWTVVNGTEFLPLSLPAVDWTGYAIDGSGWWFAAGTGVYITYCPVLPMKVVIKTTKGGFGTAPSYLGIWEGTPNVGSFPINVNCKRLGDVLTLNTDALTALPGYSNMKFEVSYTKNTIDVNATGLANGTTTGPTGAWPTYLYLGLPVPVTFTLDATQNQNARTVYDDVDAKITGTVTIKIYVDNTFLTVSTPASAMGKGLGITLSTNKVGWYNSGIIGISAEDIDVQTVVLPVN
jgi:hypothetical protein